MGIVIIHAGMHKTGSSTLQLSLSSGFSDPDYVYFDLGEKNHSGPLVNLFWEKPLLYHGNKKRGRSDNDIAKIKCDLFQSFSRQLEGLGNRSGIISAEDLCGFNPSELTKLKHFIQQYKHGIKVIAYIRPPKSYIESAYQQIIKGGYSSFDLGAAYPNYSRLLSLKKVFGFDSCIFRIFSRSRLVGGDILVDFLDLLKPGLEVLKPAQANDGISLTALKFLYCYRKHGPGYGSGPNAIRINNILVARLARITGPKLRLSHSALHDYFNSSLDDLRALDELLPSTELSTFYDESPNDSQHCIRQEQDLVTFDNQELHKLLELGSALGIHMPKDLDYYNDPLNVAKVVKMFMPVESASENVKSVPVVHTNQMVVEGAEGFLFLTGGSHSPLDFANGTKTVDTTSVKVFWNNIKNRRAILRNRKISYLHVVVPDKHNICEDIFPYDIKLKLGVEFLDRGKAEFSEIIEYVDYPLDILSHDFQRACLKVDTHLSLYGNIRVLDSLNKRFSSVHQAPLATDEDISYLYELEMKTALSNPGWEGDLGSKLDPTRRESRKLLPEAPNLYFFSNNYAGGNNGICDLYINLDKLKDSSSVVVFGDSYGQAMSRTLARIVGEVFFFRTPYLHTDIVSRINPTHVITENSERYLSKVFNDNQQYCFWLYPYLKDQDYKPPLRFVEAMNKVHNRGSNTYTQWIQSLQYLS